jgi:hypothetical protein
LNEEAEAKCLIISAFWPIEMIQSQMAVLLILSVRGKEVLWVGKGDGVRNGGNGNGEM